jgi:hypothetical protein
MAKDKDTNACAKIDCALLGKPQGFPGNLWGLSGFKWDFSRDPRCLCGISVCSCGVFRDLSGKSVGSGKSIRSLTD